MVRVVDRTREFFTERTDFFGACDVCGRELIDGAPDPCLGELPGVRAACCGHGDRERAYMMFDNGVILDGFQRRNL